MTTLTLKIYGSMRRKVLSGELPAGARLVIRHLAHEYDTSDIPIREALRMLERDGLVEMIPYKGARIVNPSPKEIEEGYLIRGYLESLATRTAVEHVTDDHFAQLERCRRKMDRAVDTGDGLQYAELNREFHQIIFSASPYRRLQNLIESIWDGQSSYQMVFRLSPQRLRSSHQEHQLIIEALRNRDHEAAGALALRHKLSVSEALIQAVLEAGDDETDETDETAEAMGA